MLAYSIATVRGSTAVSIKRGFLSSLALALATLAGSATSKADAPARRADAAPSGDPGEKRAIAPFQLPEFLVIGRSPETGEVIARHSSHSSHSSHASHRSHYSSR
ncbi:MAG: hypothetical protein IPK81_13940 [Rhodospirillales bacterium]|nr:MAG: hypothetical protein IPK81_13940 [Rhodospirillales bacterium]